MMATNKPDYMYANYAVGSMSDTLTIADGPGDEQRTTPDGGSNQTYVK